MRDGPRPTGVAVVLLAIAAVAAIGPMAAGALTPHDSPGNWTVVPGNHQPGADGADYKHFAVGQAAWDHTHEGRGLRKVDYMVLTWDEGSFAQCTLFNAEAFGFDRDNDQSGTQTDDFAGTYIENFAMKEDVMWMDFNDEDDAGQTSPFARNDQFVAHQTGCYQNPDEAGWYRVFGWMNGTDHAGEHRRAELYSHYFYICDCESYDDAVDQMGPPPSQAQATPTPTATTTTTSEPATPGGPQTATATPDGGSVTASPTDDGGTAQPTATTEAPGTSAPAGTDTPTPTAGGGPGFTAIAAVLGLLVAAVVGLRRR